MFYASTELINVVNRLISTSTGTYWWNQAVQSPINVNINISHRLILTDNGLIQLGNTHRNLIKDESGQYSTKIELYQESADVYGFYHNYQSEDVMAAVLGHEFVHAVDKENWILGKDQIEVKPTKVEFDILKKLNDLKVYPNLKIIWERNAEPYNYSVVK